MEVFDDSRIINQTSDVLHSLWLPTISSPSFHGSASMVKFEDVRGENSNKMENCNDDLDGSFQKKRRLSPNQVVFLEKSFKVENKLEPERKIQLAKELNLQPRQVAIWFQNRRARYKTKVLEKDYDSLKANYDKLKSDYENLFKENEKMKTEVKLLKKDAAASSVKSDVFDSDSPHCTDGPGAVLEPTTTTTAAADSNSHVFESDFSQDEDEGSLSKSLLHPPHCFPKLEVDQSYDDLQPNSCNLGFPVQDQGTWFWQY